MSDDLLKRLRKWWEYDNGRLFENAVTHIEKLTAERDRVYASGYSDAETEISKSALGQRNDFLHSQYANAKLRIEALTVDRAEARAGWHKYEGAWMTAEGKLADVEAERDRLRQLLSEIDKCIVWEALGFGNDFADQVQAALKGETP